MTIKELLEFGPDEEEVRNIRLANKLKDKPNTKNLIPVNGGEVENPALGSVP